MKLQEALNIINKPKIGFMVSFEVKERGVLRSDHFPDFHGGEELIQSETEAWELAKKFSEATDNTCNIYVIDHTFSPVKNYSTKKLKSY